VTIMNIIRIAASTLALVSTLSVVPAVAQASEPPRPPPPTVERDRDHRGDRERVEHGRDRDRDVRWGYDRDGRWGRFDRDHRRDFDRDWIGYRPTWVSAGMKSDALCRFEWENGASPERMFQIGCFVR
jgi:hypothetical protein